MDNFIYQVGEDALLPNGFVLGNAQDEVAGTGCTAILCKQGATASVKVHGGAPATRETDLLQAENMVQAIHAVVLSGGSAFGLDACSGVMRYLEERSVGLPFLGNFVPIVVGASLFDLALGDGSVRPDAAMGYAAASVATDALDVQGLGNFGAGCGASVGKLLGPQTAMKSGLGAASVQVDELIVTAIVAVNASGNIHDRENGKWLAGALDPSSLADKPRIIDPYVAFDLVIKSGMLDTANANSNTTIGAILTNAKLSKPQAAKAALMAHDGYARSIEPVHTSFDGDAIFCLASGEISGQHDFVGVLGAKAMELAVQNAVLSANSAYGLLANSDL